MYKQDNTTTYIGVGLIIFAAIGFTTCCYKEFDGAKSFIHRAKLVDKQYHAEWTETTSTPQYDADNNFVGLNTDTTYHPEEFHFIVRYEGSGSIKDIEVNSANYYSIPNQFIDVNLLVQGTVGNLSGIEYVHSVSELKVED